MPTAYKVSAWCLGLYFVKYAYYKKYLKKQLTGLKNVLLKKYPDINNAGSFTSMWLIFRGPLLGNYLTDLWTSTYYKHEQVFALREESNKTNVILQYKLLALILNGVCSVILQSEYILHF